MCCNNVKRRNTPTKQAVLALLTEPGKAMSQDTIEERITIKINRATIYRILNQFYEDGILCRAITDNGKQYFALRRKREDNTSSEFHLHFHCLKCNQVECLPTTADFLVPEGYALQHANFVLSGICQECTLVP
jgi:Fur family ferric uptake transcriptional regulator